MRHETWEKTRPEQEYKSKDNKLKVHSHDKLELDQIKTSSEELAYFNKSFKVFQNFTIIPQTRTLASEIY